MYVLGAVEAFQTGFGIPTLFPMDREIIALAVMVVLALVVYVGLEWVSRTMYVFLTLVVVSIILGLGGLIAFGAGASFGSTDAVLPATGPLWTSTFTPDPDTGITPSFQTLLAIFYPSVTGIMAGSNRSGLLKDPSASIPVGTLSAIAVTTVLYVLTITLFGSIVDAATLKANKLVFASVAWPIRDVVSIGVVASSIGAALQCLTGAPQILATMLADDVLPFVPAAQNLASAIASCLCGRGAGTKASTSGADADADAPAGPEVHSSHPDCDEAFEDRFGTVDELEAIRVHRQGSSVTSKAAEAGVEIAAKSQAADVAAAASAAAPTADGADSDDDDDLESGHRRGATAAPSGKGVAGARELFVTWILASLPCLAGNLDQITPIQTEFFLMLYLTINLACFLQTFYYSPSFRPRWPVHWVVPAFGVAGCLTLMFLVQWWQALAAIAIAFGLHQWVRYGEQVDEWGTWGASLASVTFGQASTALLALRNVSSTASTWRPQLLVLVSSQDDGEPTRPELLSLAAQLKKGKGVTMATSVRSGLLVSVLNKEDERRRARAAAGGAPERRSAFDVCVADPQRRLQARMASAGIDGFAQLVVAPNVFDALETAVQTSGISALRPNSVLLGWPRDWRTDPDRARSFVTLCKSVLRMRKSLVTLRVQPGAAPLTQPQTGTMDLYWMGSDSGLILLLPYLLTRHPVWRRCRLRLFAVDPALEGKTRALQSYLAAMRIPAEVHIVPVDAAVIDQSLQGRTLTADAAQQLQAELEAARRRGDLDGPEPTSPLRSTARALEGQDAAASSMTMALGQPGAGRRSAGARPSVFQLFGAPEDGGADGKAGPSTPASKSARGDEDDDEDDNDHGDAAPADDSTVASRIVRAAAEGADRHDEPSSPGAAAEDVVPAVGGPSPFVESAARLNAIIREHSSDASLVVASLMLSRNRDPIEFLQYTEQFCAGIPRAVLVRGTGSEVLSSVA